MATIKFKATSEQMSRVMANAVNASIPMGMGILHYKMEHEFKPEEFGGEHHNINLDYVEGRMVKLRARKDGDVWEMNDDIRADYESWISRYPTVTALLESAGINDIIKD